MHGWLPPWVPLASSDRIDGALLVLLLFGLTVVAVACARLSPHSAARERHRRGARIVRRRRWSRISMMLNGMHDGRLQLAGIAIPPADEAKHFKIIGTTGTGKST